MVKLWGSSCFQKYGELHMGPYCSPGMFLFTPSHSLPLPLEEGYRQLAGSIFHGS